MEKNRKVVTMVVGPVTPTQAANIQKDMIKSKEKHAPHARATVAIGSKETVSKTLKRGHKQVLREGTEKIGKKR